MRFGSTMPRLSWCGLCGIGLRHAAQSDLAVRVRRQNYVMGLNARELFGSSVRGQLPSPARACHSSSVFHSTKARKHTRMCACTRSAR